MSDIATLIKDAGAVKTGKFKLSDGSLTDYYIDKYVFETQPDVLAVIAEEIASQLGENNPDVIAGPELGAVPLVTAVSLHMGLPAAYIRKREKHSATQARIEGTVEKGMQVAIVEDVTTTGNTILDTAKLIEEVGGIVDSLTVVVDRNAGAAEKVQEAGYELSYLTQVGKDLDVESLL